MTLATTMKALWPTSRTITPAPFWYAGKIIRVTAFGKLTTDGTAGNYVFEMAYGTGDAPASPIAVGATVAGTVSQTNITWTAQGYVECRSAGPTGVIRMWGIWEPAVAVLASTLQPYLFPNATPADLTLDTTNSTFGPTFQLQRSGAGVWTAATTSVFIEELN